jgi:hypothetical protein
MRKALAALLFTLTGACLLLAGSVASTVFDDYEDSEDSYYLGMAAVPFIVALVCLAGGIWALRGPTR